MGITTILKAVILWIKSYPWETVVLITLVLPTTYTHAFLGVAGATVSSIAIGLDLDIHPDRRITDIRIGSITADIQANIGNVIAASIFATLTSAASCS